MRLVGGERGRRATWLGAGVVLLGLLRASAVEFAEFPQLNCSATCWTVEDGLPGNAVWALAPGRKGYLWAAGLNGIARFDGVRFVRFRLSEGLRSLQVMHLMEDREGRLWVGTEDGGLSLREHGRFEAFTATNGVGDKVYGLAEDRAGSVWVAHSGGLARWDGGRFRDMALPHAPSRLGGCTSVWCGSNSVWAVGFDGNLYQWQQGQWQEGPRLQKKGFRLDKVLETRDGRLWARLAPYGLAERQGESWQVFGPESGLPKSYLMCVLEREQGGLLCGTYDRGMYLWADGRATAAGLNQPPEQDGVLSLEQDRLGNLWVGTRTKGLMRLRPPQVQVVPGSERARIMRLTVEHQGRLWLGSGEGLWFERQGQLVPVTPPPPLRRFSVSLLEPCAAGGVWFSVSGSGLWEFDPDRDPQPVRRIAADKSDVMGAMLAEAGGGSYWYGTESGALGLLRPDGQTNLLTHLARAPNQRLVGLMADGLGGVWARLASAALVHVDQQGRELERVGRAQGLPINSVRCWVGDGEGGLWMGSPSGLYWWRHSRLLLFDTRQGLPEDILANLAKDAAGNLWCAGQTLLFRLSRQELEAVATNSNAVVHARVIGRSAGLNAVPFAAGIASAAVRGPQGRLYFPRIWDVISFDPAAFAAPEPAPVVLLEEVSIDGRPLALPSPENTLRIPPGRGDLEIRYTGLECADPPSLHFRYRLEGVDRDWTEVGEQRVVTFRHLPPGAYRFRVSASAAGGAWAEPGAALELEVEPFLWQTAWFRGLGLVAVLGVTAGLGWRRVRALEQRRAAQDLFSRRLLESQEAERRRIAAELHDGLGQNLVLVKNLALLCCTAGNCDPSTTRTGEIAAAAERALEEVHAISYALRPPELDRLGLSKALASLVRRAGEASGIRFEAEIALEGTLPPGADIQLFRIAQEAISNLVKHAGANTARVELWRDEQGIHLLVADDGRGLPVAHERVQTGNGLGLAGIEERARLLGAQCRWLSGPGQGTTLTVLLKS